MFRMRRILTLPFSLRQQRLARERAALSGEDFVRKVVEGGGDPEAARQFHERLKDWICADGFTPYPEDDLGRVFGMAEEELDEDFLLGVFTEIGVVPPDRAQMARFGRVDTPLAAARLVSLARNRPSKSLAK